MDPQPFFAIEAEAWQRERSLKLLALDVVDHVLVEGAQHGVRRDIGDPGVQLPVAVAALGRVVPRRRLPLLRPRTPSATTRTRCWQSATWCSSTRSARASPGWPATAARTRCGGWTRTWRCSPGPSCGT